MTSTPLVRLCVVLETPTSLAHALLVDYVYTIALRALRAPTIMITLSGEIRAQIRPGGTQRAWPWHH
ncbi:hypothetical protein MMC07_009215, partial [Pseudocyphellaria aurata]|nr:hypothetical protein [Pseudocyphellaria aurata]